MLKGVDSFLHYGYRVLWVPEVFQILVGYLGRFRQFKWTWMFVQTDEVFYTTDGISACVCPIAKLYLMLVFLA